MILKTGILTEDDFHFDLDWQSGWVLVAPYIALEIEYDALEKGKRFYGVALRRLPTALGPALPITFHEWHGYRLPELKMPKKFCKKRLWLDLADLNQVADYARKLKGRPGDT